MAKSFLTNLELSFNQLLDAVLHQSAGLPTDTGSPQVGQVYYDTTLNQFGFYNGSTWVYPGVPYSADEATLHLSGTIFSIHSGVLGTAASHAATDFDAAGTAAGLVSKTTPLLTRFAFK